MSDFLNYLITQITTYPENVNIEKIEDESQVKYIINADKRDIGKIIGKDGKTINAVRILVRSQLGSLQKNIDISINSESK